MFLIPCPWCGPRDDSEFSYGGEAHIDRPRNLDKLSDEAWADYLFKRTNPKGRHHERWVHAAGCRRWFNVVRDTVSHEITAVYKMGERPPEEAAAEPPEAPPEEKAEAPVEDKTEAAAEEEAEGRRGEAGAGPSGQTEGGTPEEPQ